MKYLQIQPNGVYRDEDGFYCLPLPIEGFIQGENGAPIEGYYRPVGLYYEHDSIVFKAHEVIPGETE